MLNLLKLNEMYETNGRILSWSIVLQWKIRDGTSHSFHLSLFVWKCNTDVIGDDDENVRKWWIGPSFIIMLIIVICYVNLNNIIVKYSN